jgi:hypothetical protein
MYIPQSVPRILPRGKDGRCVGLTTLPTSCADCLEILEPQPPGTPKGLSRPVAGKLYLLHTTMKLLHACQKRNKILHWENLYIKKYNTEGKLITEQTPREHNVLFTLEKLATSQAILKTPDITHNT